MSTFLKLTAARAADGDANTFINFDLVTAVFSDHGKTNVVMVEEDNYWVVTETPEQIMEMLATEREWLNRRKAKTVQEATR